MLKEFWKHGLFCCLLFLGCLEISLDLFGFSVLFGFIVLLLWFPRVFVVCFLLVLLVWGYVDLFCPLGFLHLKADNLEETTSLSFLTRS